MALLGVTLSLTARTALSAPDTGSGLDHHRPSWQRDAKQVRTSFMTFLIEQEMGGGEDHGDSA
jgi:hypothetical protein